MIPPAEGCLCLQGHFLEETRVPLPLEPLFSFRDERFPLTCPASVPNTHNRVLSETKSLAILKRQKAGDKSSLTKDASSEGVYSHVLVGRLLLGAGSAGRADPNQEVTLCFSRPVTEPLSPPMRSREHQGRSQRLLAATHGTEESGRQPWASPRLPASFCSAGGTESFFRNRVGKILNTKDTRKKCVIIDSKLLSRLDLHGMSFISAVPNPRDVDWYLSMAC